MSGREKKWQIKHRERGDDRPTYRQKSEEMRRRENKNDNAFRQTKSLTDRQNEDINSKKKIEKNWAQLSTLLHPWCSFLVYKHLLHILQLQGPLVDALLHLPEHNILIYFRLFCSSLYQQEVLTWAPPDFIQLILLTIYCN